MQSKAQQQYYSQARLTNQSHRPSSSSDDTISCRLLHQHFPTSNATVSLHYGSSIVLCQISHLAKANRTQRHRPKCTVDVQLTPFHDSKTVKSASAENDSSSSLVRLLADLCTRMLSNRYRASQLDIGVWELQRGDGDSNAAVINCVVAALLASDLKLSRCFVASSSDPEILRCYSKNGEETLRVNRHRLDEVAVQCDDDGKEREEMERVLCRLRQSESGCGKIRDCLVSDCFES